MKYRVPSQHIGTFKEHGVRLLRGERIRYNEFWALRDLSLNIYRGELFGIVGRNGAGKSTLLKVVARVLRPTTGRVWVKGRVAPLLELGAGFHPELTGRENVFLNGTLLGRSRREVAERFSEILTFAEIEDFIEAPLRTYSTGMVARLGFATAMAWEPDVLILDEVLAVGDAAFQEKCKERIKEFRGNGTTILLVSHAATTVASMCDRAVWLHRGVVKTIGPAHEVATAYAQAEG
ncbi:MAG: ABC transporter ATP-binding protein [Candidatus Methylomirabilis sp.]